MHKRKILISALISIGLLLSCTGIAQADSTNSLNKTLTLKPYYDTYHLYDKHGKKLKEYKGSTKLARPVKGQRFKYYGKPKVIKKRVYYYVGHNGYVRGYDIDTLDGENVLLLNHNSYIYNKKGVRLKKFHESRKNTFAYKHSPLKYSGTIKKITSPGKKLYFLRSTWSNPYDRTLKPNYTFLPYKTIKGYQYYYLGSGGYVKVNNVSFVANQYVYTRKAVITLVKKSYMTSGKNIPIYNEKGKPTKKKLKSGSKVVVDYTVNSNLPEEDAEYDFDYYHIKGKKNGYIIAQDAKSVPRQNLENKEVKNMDSPALAWPIDMYMKYPELAKY